MARLRVRPLPLALLAVAVVIAVASVPPSVGHQSAYDVVLYPLNAVALGVAGALIATHRPANPIGWLLCGIGVAAALAEWCEGYGNQHGWPWALQLEWAGGWLSKLGIGCVAILLTLFPAGRGLSRVRRALLATGIVATALMMVDAAFGRSSDPMFDAGANPYAVGGLQPLYVAGQLLFNVSLVGAVGSLILRFRRATGVERQQLKWVVYVVSVLAVVGPLASFLYDVSGLVRVAIAVVSTALPAAICVAILRYRLHDIDVIVTGTLVYGSLTVLLAAAYLGTALVLGAALGERRSAWVTAGATLAAVAVFRPLRVRIQDAVDRRFRRARYDALARVDAFLDDLRAGRADPEALEGVLREVMAQPDIEIRYLLPHSADQIDGGGRDVAAGGPDGGGRDVAAGGPDGGGRDVAAGGPDGDGRDVAAGDPGGRSELLVERAGVPLAVVHSGTGTDAVLLGQVVARAGLAIEIARLGAEVRHQLAQVEASRARILAAGYEERRRLERDLHDGAQQRLVSVGIALRNTQFALGDLPAARDIDAAVEQITVAITDLRELANGLRPASLDNGLDAALRELAGRTPLPVDVDTGSGRFPQDLEATAYFVACEALTNAVKHATATAVEVNVRRLDGHLVLTVHDNGVGGAHPARGTGLRGLSDRVAAHGGRIRLASEPGRGTTVIAELPCAS